MFVCVDHLPVASGKIAIATPCLELTEEMCIKNGGKIETEKTRLVLFHDDVLSCHLCSCTTYREG